MQMSVPTGNDTKKITFKMLKCLSYKFQYPKLHYFPLVKSLNYSQSHIDKNNMCSNQKLNEYAKKYKNHFSCFY